jgi:hypothetical protein
MGLNLNLNLDLQSSFKRLPKDYTPGSFEVKVIGYANNNKPNTKNMGLEL